MKDKTQQHQNLEDKLVLASINGNLNEIRSLVQQGANVHVFDSQPLRVAGEYGHLDVIKYLVEQEADIHADDDATLFWADYGNNIDVVKYILSSESEIYWLTHFREDIRKIYRKYAGDKRLKKQSNNDSEG